MVTVKERTIHGEVRRGGGRLSERLEQDLAEALDEFGAPAEEAARDQVFPTPQTGLAYGIPMAGVRYYEFAPGA